MKRNQHTLLRRIFATTFPLLLACSASHHGLAADAITAAKNADEKEAIAAPGLEETKKIAEEGFIYGLPIVMNYAVMYEYAVDKHIRSSRRRSTTSRTKRTSSPTRTRQSSRRTAIPRIPSRGWTCGRSRSFYPSRRWKSHGTTP